jgi:hypothetical protein
MSLKLGPLPDRNPMKVAIVLSPEVYNALGDYAALHAKSYGKEAPLPDLAALMIEEFLKTDAAFKRARKAFEKQPSSKEKG